MKSVAIILISAAIFALFQNAQATYAEFKNAADTSKDENLSADEAIKCLRHNDFALSDAEITALNKAGEDGNVSETEVEEFKTTHPDLYTKITGPRKWTSVA